MDSVEDVVKRVKKLKIKLGLITKETLEEEKMSLLNIPDDQLNAEQLKVFEYFLFAIINKIFSKIKCNTSSNKKPKQEHSKRKSKKN